MDTPEQRLQALMDQALAVEPGWRREFLHVMAALGELRRRLVASEARADRSQRLLEHSLSLAGDHEAPSIGKEVLDAMVSLSGATRGFVGVVDPRGGWRLLAARELSEADIDDPVAQVSSGMIRQVLDSGDAVLSADAMEETWGERGSVQRLALKSVACLPIRSGDRVIGFVYVDNPDAKGVFDRVTLEALQGWLPLVAEHLAKALVESEEQPFPGYITRSVDLLAELRELARLARFNVPVLITGPTGTGKSHLASAIHARSSRADGPFIHVNCSAVPETLLEGELFGAEAGAYTGARGRRVGRFEAARGGTLFLDEIDTMPVSGQVKLLVALQEQTVTPLGSNRPVKVDCRIIAATNADPQQAIAQGRLRQDLYFRLARVETRLPALAQRREDIPALANHILAQTRDSYGLPRLRLGPEAMDQLRAHHWPGNVRELENALVRAALLAEDGVIGRLRLAADPTAPRARKLTVTKEEFLDAWARSGGVAAQTARLLGVSKRTAFRLKKKYLA